MINRKEELPLRKLIQNLLDEDSPCQTSHEDPRSIMTKEINSVSYRRNEDSSD